MGLLAAAASASIVNNDGFETSNVLPGGFNYSADQGGTVAASPWSFASRSGIATNGSTFNGSASEGSAYAFLQTYEPTSTASVSQAVTLVAGQQYHLTYDLASRQGVGFGGTNAVTATVDGVEVNGTVTGTNGWTSQGGYFVATNTGVQNLAFTATSLDPTSLDATSFVDRVGIEAVPEPTTLAVFCAGMALLKRRKNAR